jgi:cysteine desulfurase
VTLIAPPVITGGREVGDGAGIYLDANATARPLSEVVALVASVMRDGYANPSSAHWLGSDARALIEQARDGVASLLRGTLPEGVVFTSGGTEGNNAVLSAFGRDVAGSGRDVDVETLVTTAFEHPSVLRPAEAFARAGGRLILVPMSPDGLVDASAVFAAVASARGPVTLSVQWANSETGVVQPMQDIVTAARCARPDVLMHSDVAQAFGRVVIDLDAVPLDVVTFSGHKLHAPQGIGAMVFRNSDERRVPPLILGGGQERGLRSGTQNVAGAAGMGLAVRLRAEGFAIATSRLTKMRDAFEGLLLDLVPDARVNGAPAPRVPNTSSIRFPGIEAMELVARLDARGLACSVGSACSASKPEPSRVLIAMGLSEQEAFSSVRFSFSILNSMDEAVRAARIVADTCRGMT